MSSAGMIAASILATMKSLFQMDSVTHVASVELWVLMTTLLLVGRFALDCCFRPWHAVRPVAATIQVVEMLNYSMVHYTLGLMQLSAKRVNDYFQVWAVLLVTLQYSVKTGRPYRKSNQIPVLDLMSSLWAANLLRMQTFYLLRIPLWLIWALNAVRIISYFVTCDRAAILDQENTRLVSDYMRYEHTLGPSGDAANEFSMQWYKYLVSGEDLVLRDARRQDERIEQYRIRLDPHNKKLVTIDKIWNLDAGRSGLLGSTKDTDNRLKDVCLSFALYKLLRRRFYNLPIHEASQEKTRQLVFDYILQENTDNYERAFRVTEVELAFLQDLFCSRRAAMFAAGFPVFNMLMSLFLVGATGYLAYPVHYIPERMDQADKNIITHGVTVTRIIVGLIIVKELLEFYLYVFSQWTKVLLICKYIKHQCMQNPVVEAAMRMMFWFISEKWDQTVFQYNLLVSYSHKRKKASRRIKLQSEVKTAIFESLKDLQQHPERLDTYFLNAFGSNEALMKKLTWEKELEADTHMILVWHIATCFCEIHFSDEVKKLKVLLLGNRLLARKSKTPEDVWPHYLTAVSLSNYCAYLLTKALVPDNGFVVTKVFNAVRKETFRATYCSFFQSMGDVYNKLVKVATEPTKESEKVVGATCDTHESSVFVEEGIKISTNEEDHEEERNAFNNSKTNDQIPDREDTITGDGDIHNSITQMGARLGKQLTEAYGEDRLGLWRDLSVFWTGFLLHLAASTRAAKHKTRLGGKGELITHLWVLLSHAGFLGNIKHGQTLLDPHDLDDV